MAKHFQEFGAAPDFRDTHGTHAEVVPSVEFCEQVGRMVETHLRNGHFVKAVQAIESKEREFHEHLAEQRAELSRGEAEWLQAPLAELKLNLRTLNALEEVGCETIRDALDMLNSGERIPNFGIVKVNEVWNAVRKLGVQTPRVEPPTDEEAESNAD